jgi:hypothetical protein
MTLQLTVKRRLGVRILLCMVNDSKATMKLIKKLAKRC